MAKSVRQWATRAPMLCVRVATRLYPSMGNSALNVFVTFAECCPIECMHMLIEPSNQMSSKLGKHAAGLMIESRLKHIARAGLQSAHLRVALWLNRGSLVLCKT